MANTSQLQEGRYPAMLELMQSGVSQTMAIPIKVVLVMVGKPRTSFLQTGMSDSTHAYASATTQLSLQQMGLSVSTTVRLVSAGKERFWKEHCWQVKAGPEKSLRAAFSGILHDASLEQIAAWNLLHCRDHSCKVYDTLLKHVGKCYHLSYLVCPTKLPARRVMSVLTFPYVMAAMISKRSLSEYLSSQSCGSSQIALHRGVVSHWCPCFVPQRRPRFTTIILT